METQGPMGLAFHDNHNSERHLSSVSPTYQHSIHEVNKGLSKPDIHQKQPVFIGKQDDSHKPRSAGASGYAAQ